MMRNYQSLGSSVAEAVRQGSISGPEPLADYHILSVLEDNLVVSRSELTRVVVFHASSPTDEPPTGCRNGIPSTALGHECNVYTVNDLDRPKENFGCKAPGTLDSFWCPTARHDGGINFSETDLVGIYVEVEHSFATGFFGQTLTLSRTSILPLERGK